MKRIHFINKCLKAAAASLLFPSVINNKDTFAKVSPQSVSFKPEPDKWKDDEINIAWIGHATILINFYGTWILTDPVLFETIGIYILGTNWGPSRFTHPALTIDEIPKPDIILLSHAHMDHMDYATLSEITKKFPEQIDCITAYNTMDVIADLHWKTLQEIDWGDDTEISGVTFKALEVKHFGWRFPWEWDRSKGYMKEGLLQVIQHAFGELGLNRLEANIQPDNHASIALAQSTGFQYEGFSPRLLRINGEWCDHERWAILADAG